MVLALPSLGIRVQSNIGIIRAGVARGLSSSSIQGLIRATGQPGVRRVDLLQGIRHVQGIVESGVRIQNTRRDRRPDPSRIARARGTLISNFSYEVRIGPRVLDDGSLNQRFLTVRSDTNLTPEQILDEAERALAEAPESTRYQRLKDSDTLTVTGAVRK